MSFFTLPVSHKKRKREITTSRATYKKARTDPKSSRTQRPKRDESISGSESDEERDRNAQEVEDLASSSESDELEETGAERRLRLAERYLENIRDEVEHKHGFDAAEIDRDLIAERLKEDVGETKGRLYRHIASTFAFNKAIATSFRSHSASVNSIAVCPPYVYTASADTVLTKWELAQTPAEISRETRKQSKLKDPRCQAPPPIRRRPSKVLSVKPPSRSARVPEIVSHHTGSILSVAASSDNQFVVTGGDDHRLIVWSASTLQLLKVFSQHRDSVTSLSFRRGTNQLYSASKDRTVKTWSLNELAYVETLFGHQDCIVDIAALAQERCLSAGARDRTARLWKVVDETNLIYLGGGGGNKKAHKGDKRFTDQSKYAVGSLDRVAFIDEDTFITGSDNGSIMLWNVQKKKPIFTYPLAHGLQPIKNVADVSAEQDPENVDRIPQEPQPRWITALATVPYSDIIVSGSWDGWVRAWKVSQDKRRLEPLGPVGVTGASHQDKGYSVLNGSQEERPELEGEHDGALKGVTNGLSSKSYPTGSSESVEMDRGDKVCIRGVINDLKVFERGEKGQESLCIVAAVGREHRLGRWMQFDGRNDAVVLDIQRIWLEKKKKRKRRREGKKGVI